jgi:PAS domain S-box-containing protein
MVLEDSRERDRGGEAGGPIMILDRRSSSSESTFDREQPASPTKEEGLSVPEAEEVLRLLAGPNVWADRESDRVVGPRAFEDDASTGKEDLVRRAESRYRNLVEQLPAVTFIAALDAGDNELYVSPQIESLLGFSQREWLEDPILWYRQLHVDDRVRWHAEFAQTCAAGKHFRAEYRFMARDGRVVWVHGEAQIVRDERGRPLFLQGIAFDITARKQAEEALRKAHDELERRVLERTAELANANGVLKRAVLERERVEGELRLANEDLFRAHERALEASRTKSTFLANMSHELRTPLNAIIGYSELLQELAAQKIAKDPTVDLEKINRAGKHLLALINDILDLSKIEAGKMDLLPEAFRIADLIRETVSSVQPQVTKNANTLVIRCAEGLGTMHTDATRLRQCLLNLLSNACKFTKNGIIRLDVDRETGSDGDVVVFRVRDSGIGITPEQVGRLFQAFTQADPTTTRRYGGTGLGLAITKKISQMMGGDVTVESVSGQGSTFTIRVPETLASAPAEAIAPVAVARQVLRAEVPTVLVIDDDPTVHDLMARFLAGEGFAVLHAANGVDGLRLAHEIRPCAITLDVMMPGMDGWSTLTALKADPDLASIPVVLLTIVDSQGRGFALGASDYLTKPIDKQKLLGILGGLRRPTPPQTVLVVEDDGDTRNLLVLLLCREGWSVREAADGRAALDRVAEEIPGLILLDLMMPEMDGFEFVLELRRTEAWRFIPVVVVTAKDITAEDVQRLQGCTNRVFRKDASQFELVLGEVRKQLRTIACLRPSKET